METTLLLGYIADILGFNNYQYDLEVQLRYHILEFYKKYGTIILVFIYAPAVEALAPGMGP